MRIYRLEDLAKGIELIKNQAIVSLSVGKPVDLFCQKVRKQRTLQQNNYLHLLYKHLVEFWETHDHFCIDGLGKKVKFINSKFLHEYLKARFDVSTTTKMTTVEFTEFIDKIQKEWSEQSEGEYEYFFPYDDTRDYEREDFYGI